jgi:hypothetical protein
MIHHRPRAVRDRRAAERRFSGARHPDHRQFRIGGRRDGPADTGRLHPDDAQVRRSRLAGPRIRRHQRAGRHRCSGRPVDRRCHHDLDQLAPSVRISGRNRRDDPAAQSPDHRSDSAGPDPPLRCVRSDLVRRRHVLRGLRDPPGRQRRRVNGGAAGDRGSVPRLVLPAHP